MALGGRPKEEGGHKPLKISVDDFVYSALDKVENKSRFIEETLRPILKQFDPGDVCQVVSEIYRKIAQEIIEATREEKYDKVAALAVFANALEDYRKLCLPFSETFFQRDFSEYTRKVTVGGRLAVRRGDELRTIGYKIVLEIEDEAQEKSALAFGRAMINSWLADSLKGEFALGARACLASVSVDDVRDMINVSSTEVPDAKILKMIKRACMQVTLELETGKEIDGHDRRDGEARFGLDLTDYSWRIWGW